MAEGEAVEGVAAAAVEEEQEDESRVVRTPRALWTPLVGLSLGDLSASSGTLKEESRTSGRQRYHRPANVLTVYTDTGLSPQPAMRAALFLTACGVF